MTFLKTNPRGAFAQVFFLVCAAWAMLTPAQAQTTATGDYTAGASAYQTYCLGCHSDPGGKLQNAALAAGHITYAFGRGMTASNNAAANLSATQYVNIATYLNRYIGIANPANRAIPYNTTGVTFDLPNLFLGTIYGRYTGVRLVSPPAPNRTTKGTVTFGSRIEAGTGLNIPTATYVPDPGMTGADSFSFEAFRSVADGGGTSAVRSVSLLIDTPAAPAITSGNAATFVLSGNNSFTITATGSPTPVVTLSGSLPAGITQSAGGGTLTLSGTPTAAEGAYPLTITATNIIAPAATQNFTLTIAKGSQSIFFTGPASQTYSTQTIALSASAGSGLPVTFARQTPSTCSVAGTTLTMLAVGTCTVSADQAGNAVYAAAAQVLQSFQINAIAQTIFFGSQQARTFGTGDFALSPLATSSLANMAITYTSQTPSVCTVSGIMVSMLATGTCTIRASQAGTATIASAFADQFIAINPPISPGLPQLVTPRLPDAFIGVPYSASLIVAATQAPTSISVPAAPPGITLTGNGAGSLTVSGTPTQAGTFGIQINATNANGTSQISVPLTVVDINAYAHNVAAVSAGGGHSCAMVGGGVQCWGSNSFGQLGNGVIGDLLYPAQIFAPGSGVTAISAGDVHTCAVVNGGVMCWGLNGGRLGNGGNTQSRVPVVAIPAGSGVTAVSAGYTHTCAVVNGGVQCWGGNTSGALGVGDTTTRLVPTQVIAAGSGVTDVQTHGRSFTTCALVAGGVQCWGLNNVGQLGNGGTTDSLVPVQTIPPGSGVTALGGSCVVRNGGVQCWGYNISGQLGDGSAVTFSTTPVQTIAEGSGATAVARSAGFVCAVVAGGLQCWGYNLNGELGIASKANSNVPVQTFANGSGVTAVSTGEAHACAILGGAVQCWGSGSRLGNVGGTATVTAVRQSLPAGSGATAVAASGWGYFSCALIAGGVQCWGENLQGQLGNGTFVSSTSPVQTIPAGGGVTALSAGFRHACVIQSGGVQCWGDGSASAAPVSGLASGVTAISSGYLHRCAVVNGGAKCWGDNGQGQLGDNSQLSSSTPVNVSGLGAGSGVTSIAAGDTHTCAVVNGGVQCWGNNSYFQLGVNFNGNRLIPIEVLPAGSGATAIAVTSDLTCVVVNGGLQCWGSNFSIPLTGNIVLAEGSNVSAVSVGRGALCVLITGGVQCMGDNTFGQLGVGSTTSSEVLLQTIPAGAGVVSVSAGFQHTCAVVAGAVTCWGQGLDGQLGDPTVLPLGRKVFAAVQAAFAPQVITFAQAASRRTTDAPFLLTATGGGSGNPVVFASQTSAVCTTGGSNGATVTLTGTAGTCTITASQAGNTTYAAATPVTQSFAVTPRVFNVSAYFSAGSNCAGPATSTFTTGTGVVEVSVCANTTSDALCGASLVLTAASGAESARFNVAGRALPVKFATANSAPAFPLAVTSPPQASDLGGTSSTGPDLPGTGQVLATLTLAPQSTATNNTYQLSLGAASTALVDNDGSCAQPVSAPLTAALTLNRVSAQAITFAALADKLTTDAAFALVATGGASGNPVVFTSATPAVCTTGGSNGSVLTLTGTPGVCTVNANQAGNASHAAAPEVTRSFTVTAPVFFVVTPSAGANGSIAPATVQNVLQGATTVFTMTPNAGYQANPGGTCGGSLQGNTYTTVPVTATCTVIANFAPLPGNAPGAPVIGAATAGDGQVSVSFSAPASTGGSPITSYTANCFPGGAQGSGSASPIAVSGLVNGTALQCAVSATNANGTGPLSALSNAVTPAAANGAALWSAQCSACHGAVPTGNHLNPAGTTGTVLGYVIANQPLMALLPTVTGLSAADRVTLASYIAQQSPVATATTTAGSAVGVNTGVQLTLNTIAFDAIEVVSPPANGSISNISGTTITYLPAPGFTGVDTFTYRGKRSAAGLSGDPRLAVVTVTAASVPALLNVVSRKVHGAAGALDIPIATGIAVGGNITTEPRAGTGGHVLVFQFDGAVSSATGITATDAGGAPVGSISSVVTGNDVLVTLNDVPDRSRVRVAIGQVNGVASTPAVAVGFLRGDVNDSRVVTSADVSAIKARAGAAANVANARYDINLSGVINASDIAVVKARAGVVSALP